MNERQHADLIQRGLGDLTGLDYPLSDERTAELVVTALTEDKADNDITTIATILSDRHSRCMLVARRPGVVCGINLAIATFQHCDPKVVIRKEAKDGDAVERGAILLYINGNAHGLLSAERVALNFMQRLSGIATLTSQYVSSVEGTHAKILDTRKTTPGWRLLEKYAVRCGGGVNHRNDLSGSVLIKDNHLAALDGDVKLAVARARAVAPQAKVEVECDNLDQVSLALKAGADIIMLDNMGLAEMREAVQMISGRAVVEASGGVNLQTVKGIAQTGVDWISVGALTHSPPALDLALDFEL